MNESQSATIRSIPIPADVSRQTDEKESEQTGTV